MAIHITKSAHFTAEKAAVFLIITEVPLSSTQGFYSCRNTLNKIYWEIKINIFPLFFHLLQYISVMNTERKCTRLPFY